MNNIKRDALINYENAIKKKHTLRDEESIINKWSENPLNPIVSIFCTAYNHEIYIEDTIRGFLIQETNFPFEVLIHDDASTDNTPQIIKKYESAYPNIIKPIYQKENQYSKGIEIISRFNLPRAKGKFIAFCEGDDFWIDPYKLAKQIQALKDHPYINLCFSPAICLYPDGEIEQICSYKDNTYIFPVDKVIQGGGEFMPTCTLITKRNVLEEFPQWFEDIAPVGDYFIQILTSLSQGALYIPDFTSVYRANTIGSWSNSLNSIDNKTFINRQIRMAYCLEAIDIATNYQYSDSLQEKISSYYLLCALKYLSESDYSQVKKYIELSWNAKSNLNYKQFILKRFFKLSPLVNRTKILRHHINRLLPRRRS